MITRLSNEEIWKSLDINYLPMIKISIFIWILQSWKKTSLFEATYMHFFLLLCSMIAYYFSNFGETGRFLLICPFIQLWNIFDFDCELWPRGTRNRLICTRTEGKIMAAKSGKDSRFHFSPIFTKSTKALNCLHWKNGQSLVGMEGKWKYHWDLICNCLYLIWYFY